MSSMLRDHTIWTATGPDAAFTSRTYPTRRDYKQWLRLARIYPLDLTGQTHSSQYYDRPDPAQ